jgi:hypothetical protein
MKLLAHAALALGLALAPAAFAAEPPATDDPQAVADITARLNDFLAHVDQAATHDKWWASDLVYMPSAGGVTSKAEIMKGFEAAPPEAAKDAPPAEPEAPESYTAEDILVRTFGDTASLTFRLVRHAADGRHTYRNSGMLVRRDGRWQVVTWQATKEPEAEAK